MKKNLLVTATTFPRSKDDAEGPFVLELSKHLAARGYGITVLVPHAPGAKRKEQMGALTVLRFPYFWPLRWQRLCYDGGIIPNMKRSWLARIQVPFLVLAELVAVHRQLNRQRYDAVHAHWIIPQGFVAAMMEPLHQTPYVVTAHAGDIFPLRSGFLKMFARIAVRKSSVCTVNSAATGKAVAAVQRHPAMDVIPMGIDPQAFRPGKPDMQIKGRYGIKGPLLLNIGRLAEKKGLRYLIQAMPAILEKHPDAKLMLVGGGPEKETLMGIAAALEVTEAIIFVDRVPNKELPKFYRTADLFILPSIVTAKGDTEGLGVVLLEALACKCPVVASDVGGIGDIVKHRKTGLLFPQKDSARIAAAVHELLSSSSLRKKLAAAGHHHVLQHFTWDVVAHRFDELLQRL